MIVRTVYLAFQVRPRAELRSEPLVAGLQLCSKGPRRVAAAAQPGQPGLPEEPAVRGAGLLQPVHLPGPAPPESWKDMCQNVSDNVSTSIQRLTLSCAARTA